MLVFVVVVFRFGGAEKIWAVWIFSVCSYVQFDLTEIYCWVLSVNHPSSIKGGLNLTGLPLIESIMDDQIVYVGNGSRLGL